MKTNIQKISVEKEQEAKNRKKSLMNRIKLEGKGKNRE